MTRWHVCVTWAVTMLVLVPLGLLLCALGIALHSGTLGGEGGLCLGVATLVGSFGGMILFMDDDWPDRPPRLTRTDRRRLKAERSSIATQARIDQLEREAGVNRDRH